MAGYDVGTTGKKLTFDGTPYEGLEVTVDEAPMGLLLDIMEDYSRLTGEDLDVKAAAKVLKQLTENFAMVLESWNAERKGVAVPPTMEGIRAVGSNFFTAIVGAWLTDEVQADEELGKDSGSGTTSQEALTAAAGLSRSLPSSSPQNL
jgi:hypothetical protein